MAVQKSKTLLTKGKQVMRIILRVILGEQEINSFLLHVLLLAQFLHSLLRFTTRGSPP